MTNTASPTLAQYQALQHAYDHFNAALFGGLLPPCLITLRSSHRHYGYHHTQRFINLQGEQIDELGLHPGFFTLRSPQETLSTLVHEMVHHWQQHFGRPSRSNPHNREWAAKMRAIGLVPTATGLPGGKETGHSVSHYIDPQGAFLQACQALLTQGFALPWFDRHLPVPPAQITQKHEALKSAGVAVEFIPAPVQTIAQAQSIDGHEAVLLPTPRHGTDRVRYRCTECGIKVWGKPDLDIRCGACDAPLSVDQ